MPEKEKICENCEHWDGIDDVGYCLLNPPIVKIDKIIQSSDGVQYYQYEWIYPETHHSMRCRHISLK